MIGAENAIGWVPRLEGPDDAMSGTVESLCFAFVCQQGDLEIKACLLAASLRHFLGPDHDLVAAVPHPEDRWGSIPAATLATLKRYGVRAVAVHNPISPHYPIGNKVGCLAIDTVCKRIVFLDSDILLLRAANLRLLYQAPIAAVPASHLPFGIGEWDGFYRACGVRPGAGRMQTLVSGQQTLPYFNSGFLSVQRTLAPRLAEQWSDCARRLLGHDGLPRTVRERFLDQVSLPIAAQRMGYEITALGPEWNFPSWNWAIDRQDCPSFYHYQHLGRLMREEAAEVVFWSIIEADHVLADAVIATLRTPGHVK